MASAKVTLRAVHDTDLIKVLGRLGVYDAVVSGKYKCFVCGKTITFGKPRRDFRKQGWGDSFSM